MRLNAIAANAVRVRLKTCLADGSRGEACILSEALHWRVIFARDLIIGPARFEPTTRDIRPE
jgi:hypothetical protein